MALEPTAIPNTGQKNKRYFFIPRLRVSRFNSRADMWNPFLEQKHKQKMKKTIDRFNLKTEYMPPTCLG